LRQLGPTAVALNGLYKIGLKTGWYKRVKSQGFETGRPVPELEPLFSFPSRQEVLEAVGADGLQGTLAEADEIIAGKIRLFGLQPVDLDFSPLGGLHHWTAYETNPALLSTFHLPNDDIKYLWEPARFGFAFTLGRAYHFTGDERYAAAFWHYFETFSAINPPFLGPNWMSGQEVALRLMAFTWAGQTFSASAETTPRRLAALTASITAHAERIPPTLVYARSQNNNHLLTEAAGLYTAGLVMPENPRASKWRGLGQKWLTWCFEHQLDGTGEYIQHSTNYHRLMLQVAVWVNAITRSAATGESPRPEQEIATLPAERFARNETVIGVFSERASQNLARATRWLLALTDPESGRVPNLGANDGAYIFPLSSLPFYDYRPTLQAASLAFCEEPGFGPGPWDETAIWLHRYTPFSYVLSPDEARKSDIGRLIHTDSWGYLRAARYSSRPSHADQLHLDLWWRGLNIALDPGTYLYNAAPPWDNALTTALVHNTVTVDGLDQMTRVSKFLYLDWAQAGIIEQMPTRISAEHDGYRGLGVAHRRTVAILEDGWQVDDDLISSGTRLAVFRLHWLLPDWEWKLGDGDEEIELGLKLPQGRMTLRVGLPGSPPGFRYSLARAGELLAGTGSIPPIRGWASPTYGVKLPALSLALEVESAQAFRFTSRFNFPT